MRLQEHFEVFCLLLASSECRQQHCGKNKWGPDCSKSCPENCLDLKGVVHCHISTSECLEGCIAGWYGDLCNSNCNVNCISRTCDQENGNCSLGCEVGYVCNITPDKGEAQSEVGGYHICTGKTRNCLNHNCTRTQSGKTKCAAGCVDGFWGTICRIPCPENCQTCERLQEKCAKCQDNQYGLFCNLTCQEQCLGFQCNQAGTCSDTACTDGRYGVYCSRECGKGCKACNRTTGHCIKCKRNYYGETCDRHINDTPATLKTLLWVVRAVFSAMVFATIVFAIIAYCKNRRASWQQVRMGKREHMVVCHDADYITSTSTKNMVGTRI